MKLSDKQRTNIIAWLESMPWWEDLPYARFEEACNWAYCELEERDCSREDVLEALASAINAKESLSP